ncbi:WhiB family transcriptional regulator [Hahella sp. KA22]
MDLLITVCGTCSVRTAACRKWALPNRSISGVWRS